MKALLIILPFLAACSSSYMRTTAPSGPPGPDESKVVVYRTSPTALALTFPVYDGEELMGFTEVGSYFESIRKPGEHLFIAWGESDGVVHADLAPGKTYYLEFYPRAGFFYAGAGLSPIPATPANSPGIDGMLKKLAHRELIPERGAGWVDSHREKELKKIAKNEAKEPAKEAVLHPEDGR